MRWTSANHAGGRDHRIRISHSRHSTQAGRLADSADERHHGSADFCTASVWHSGISRFHGVVSAREEDPKATRDADREIIASGKKSNRAGWRNELREGRFQKHLCLVTAAWTFFSGVEAWYSHYKSRFRIWAQWTPVILAPIQFAACIGGFYSERVAKRLLPATSTIAMVNGGVGFFYHARGIIRRPGHTRHWLYNLLYGPPIFAPLLFSACGFLGVLASLLRREHRDRD